MKSYVKRESRISKKQKEALKYYGAQYGLSAGDTLLDWATVFKRQAPLVLEIGFGMGHNLLHLAQKYPEKNFLGVEVHRPGVGEVFYELAQNNVTNVRVFNQDINEVNSVLSDESLDAIYILFPDPWPKRRHHKRRLIQTEFITTLVQKMKVNAELHVATDWEDYAAHISKVLTSVSNLKNIYSSDQGLGTHQQRCTTKFEKRGINLGHKIWDFIFTKS